MNNYKWGIAATGIVILTVGGVVVYLQQLGSTDDLSQATNPKSITTRADSSRKTSKNVTSTSPTAQREMNLQAKREYEKADKRLNKVYQQLLSDLKSQAIADLKQAQRKWVDYKESHCKAVREMQDFGSIAPLKHNSCLQGVTEKRVNELVSSYLTESYKKNSTSQANTTGMQKLVGLNSEHIYPRKVEVEKKMTGTAPTTTLITSTTTFNIPQVRNIDGESVKKNLQHNVNSLRYGETFQSIIERAKAKKPGFSVGTTDLSYSVIFDRSGLLSIKVVHAGSGASPWETHRYYNYNTNDGSVVMLADLIKQSRMNDLMALLNKRLNENIEDKYTPPPRSSCHNQFSADKLQREHNFETPDIRFAVKPSGITFIYEFSLPASAACEPNGKVELSWDVLQPYIDQDELLGPVIASGAESQQGLTNLQAKRKYQQKDKNLNNLYQKTLSDLSNRQAANLKGAQRNWVDYKKAHCTAVRELSGSGSVATVSHMTCLEKTTKQRIRRLRSAYGSRVNQ
jgi:uncharacterized protein YecT (DUF1311 family)